MERSYEKLGGIKRRGVVIGIAVPILLLLLVSEAQIAFGQQDTTRYDLSQERLPRALTGYARQQPQLERRRASELSPPVLPASPPSSPFPPPYPPMPSSFVNLALSKPTYASSSFLYPTCPEYDCNPRYVVDGDTITTVSIYRSDIDDIAPWLSIDLGAPATIHRAFIYTRPSEVPQQGLQLRVGNTSITSISDSSKLSENPLLWTQLSQMNDLAVLDVYLEAPVVGRWVTVQSRYPPMYLVEVEVFGEPNGPAPPTTPPAPVPPPSISDPPVRGMLSECGNTGDYSTMHVNMYEKGICSEANDDNDPCPGMWGSGATFATYRFIYQNADGSRSNGLTALTMLCNNGFHTIPQLYVEFDIPISLAPGQYLVLQVKDWAYSCEPSSYPDPNSEYAEWKDVLRITFTTPRSYMFLSEGVPQVPSVEVNCFPYDPSTPYYPTTPHASQPDNQYTSPTEDLYLRLTNGPGPSMGRLEIHNGREWGTVCADGFREVEATVACRDLGYDSGVPFTVGFYSFDLFHIFLGFLDCTHTDDFLYDAYSTRRPVTLVDCYKEYGFGGVPFCNTGEVGVRCFGTRSPQAPQQPNLPPARPSIPASWSNIALGKKAYASSTYSSLQRPLGPCGLFCGPSLAVDGIINRASGTYKSDDAEDNKPWLSVDLGSPSTIHRINLYSNLNDGGFDRAEVRVGNVSITNTNGGHAMLGLNQLVWFQSNVSSLESSDILLEIDLNPPVVGQWVTVQKIRNVANTDNQALKIIELKVIGVSSVISGGPSPNQVRLMGGSAPNSGRVELYMYFSEWGTICDDGFDSEAATVVCRELGYVSGIPVPNWGGGKGILIMGGLTCNASLHNRLSECEADYEWGGRCGRLEVGVFCKDTTWPPAQPTKFKPKSIKSGGFATCVLSTRGAIKCFGRNDVGQLGLEDAVTRGDRPETMGRFLGTVDLGSRLTSSAISVGRLHACAILQPGGVVKCWGGNSGGQLGQGDTVSRGDDLGEMGHNLWPVRLGPKLTVVEISAGGYHTCALLQPGGIVKCWGLNNHGQLGLGDTQSRGNDPGEMGASLPPVDLGPNMTAIAIGAGEYHTCAILAPGGIVKCWGDGMGGALGYGNENAIGDEPGEMGANLPPVDLGRGYKAIALSAGHATTCALLLPVGVVKCWGMNWNGVLGQVNISMKGAKPNEMGQNLKPIDLGTGYSATDISLGYYHACALLKPGGAIKCWGDNKNGATSLVMPPAPSHNDYLLKWGDNGNDVGDKLPPVDVGPGLTATAITAGSDHTCALLKPGNIIKCWGLNSGNAAGTLGLGDSETRGVGQGQMGENLPPVNL